MTIGNTCKKSWRQSKSCHALLSHGKRWRKSQPNLHQALIRTLELITQLVGMHKPFIDSIFHGCYIVRSCSYVEKVCIFISIFKLFESGGIIPNNNNIISLSPFILCLCLNSPPLNIPLNAISCVLLCLLFVYMCNKKNEHETKRNNLGWQLWPRIST